MFVMVPYKSTIRIFPPLLSVCDKNSKNVSQAALKPKLKPKPRPKLNPENNPETALTQFLYCNYTFQMMMSKVMDKQVHINYVFFFTVDILFNLMIIFKVPYSGPYSLFLFIFASFHSFADTLIILYSITPYRIYCKSILEKFKLLKKNQVSLFKKSQVNTTQC